MMINRKFSTFAFLILISILPRLVLLLFYREIPQLQLLIEGGDAIGYKQLAQNLILNGEFRFDDGTLTAFRMPGYPLLLAVTYVPWQTPLPTQALQIVVDVLTVLVVFEIGRNVTDSLIVPFLAAIVIALNPIMIISAISLYPETISILSICIGILLLLRFPHSTKAVGAASLVLTLGVYMKPTLILVALVLFIIYSVNNIYNRELGTAQLRILLPFFIMPVLLTPWVVRNILLMEAFVPLTTSNGVNLYGGNNPQADGGYIFAGPYILPDMSERESDDEFTRRAVEWIKANPADFMKLLPAKAARFLWPLSLGTSGNITLPLIVFAMILSVTVIFYGLVLLGTLKLYNTGFAYETALLLTPFLCLLISSLLTFGAARFALPAFPFLAVFASLGFQEILVRMPKIS
jgi:hypothetical protein